MAEGCRCGRGALRALGGVSAGAAVTSCVLLPFASALVLVLFSVTCWTPSDAFLPCPARALLSLVYSSAVLTVLVLGCSSVPFPAVKGVVFSFSFSRCCHCGGWGGPCPGLSPEPARGVSPGPPRRLRVSRESCTVTPAPAAPARPGRGGCWRAPAPAPAYPGCRRPPPGVAFPEGPAPGAARGGGLRYLLLSYCPGRAVIYCCTECPSAAAAAAVLYVTIKPLSKSRAWRFLVRRGAGGRCSRGRGGAAAGKGRSAAALAGRNGSGAAARRAGGGGSAALPGRWRPAAASAARSGRRRRAPRSCSRRSSGTGGDRYGTARPGPARRAAPGRRDRPRVPGRCPASGGSRRPSGAPRSARCWARARTSSGSWSGAASGGSGCAGGRRRWAAAGERRAGSVAGWCGPRPGGGGRAGRGGRR